MWTGLPAQCHILFRRASPQRELWNPLSLKPRTEYAAPGSNPSRGNSKSSENYMALGLRPVILTSSFASYIAR